MTALCDILAGATTVGTDEPSAWEEDCAVTPTVAELIAPYIRERYARHEIGRAHARNIRTHLYSFSDHVGRRPLGRINRDLVESWLETDHAPGTIRVRISTVRTFYAWAIRRGHCKKNPAADIEGPRLPRRVPRALQAEQVAAMFAACPDRRSALIAVLMLQQGLRCVSIARLQIEDIDRTNHTMRISGKGGHEQLLPLMPETAAALDEYLAEYPAASGPLVRSYNQCRRGLGTHRIGRLIDQMVKDAGLKRAPWDGVSAHALRHTAATDCLRAGAHIKDVQAMLGHQHLATTEIYLPHNVKPLADAMGGRFYRRPGG